MTDLDQSVLDAWIDRAHRQDLEEAADVIERAVEDAKVETGGHWPAAQALLAKRMARTGTPLFEAALRLQVHQCTTAYAITHGYEPVPGAPGKLRPRAGGPLPAAEQAWLGRLLGVPHDDLAEAASDAED